MSCGPGRLGDWLVPDGPWAEVCKRHDEAYKKGGTPEDRKKADKAMLKEMIQTALSHDHCWFTIVILVSWAQLYYVAVRLFGWTRWKTR